MRKGPVLLSAWIANPALAQDGHALTGARITAALTDQTLIHPEGVPRVLRPTGATFHDKVSPGRGRLGGANCNARSGRRRTVGPAAA